MKKIVTRRFRKIFLILLTGFVALFCFRLMYGYTKTLSDQTVQSHFFENISSVRKNYASAKYKKSVSQSGQSMQPATGLDQKYEKVASVDTKSTQFEEEERQLRQKVKENNALIQFEQKSGNKGNRKLHIQIGVPPQKFDALYESLIQIGTVQSKQITKNDKTNEYKELNAKKASLEKIRNSLIDLKAKGGKIQEYIDLENRILEIEQQLQELGVNLGDFDDENEFCTVKFSMREGREVKISLMHRIKVALEWTIKMYMRLIITFFFLTLMSYLLVLIIDKLRIFERIVNRSGDRDD